MDKLQELKERVKFLEKENDILSLNLVKARDAANNKILKYACDFDKGILQFMPEAEEGVTTEDCEKLRDEYDYTRGSGEDVF